MFEWFCSLMCIIYTVSVIYNFSHSIFFKKLSFLTNQKRVFRNYWKKNAKNTKNAKNYAKINMLIKLLLLMERILIS